MTGGGTTNTEFEFLTGCSMANFGPGVYPYTVYDLSRTEGLPRQFSALGYATTAMHPQIGTNWNRVNAYSDLGFDRFLTIDDFEGSDTLRGHVTDWATYDKVLDVLASGSEPQFIFDVTMQNHSGYDTGLLGEEDTTHLSIDGADDPLVDEYVSLIRHSDEDLEYFIERLRELFGLGGGAAHRRAAHFFPEGAHRAAARPPGDQRGVLRGRGGRMVLAQRRLRHRCD